MRKKKVVCSNFLVPKRVRWLVSELLVTIKSHRLLIAHTVTSLLLCTFTDYTHEAEMLFTLFCWNRPNSTYPWKVNFLKDAALLRRLSQMNKKCEEIHLHKHPESPSNEFCAAYTNLEGYKNNFQPAQGYEKDSFNVRQHSHTAIGGLNWNVWLKIYVASPTGISMNDSVRLAKCGSLRFHWKLIEIFK